MATEQTDRYQMSQKQQAMHETDAMIRFVLVRFNASLLPGIPLNVAGNHLAEGRREGFQGFAFARLHYGRRV
jgi:hypothetical protein